MELVVGEGPFREPPTVMQATIDYFFDFVMLFMTPACKRCD